MANYYVQRNNKNLETIERLLDEELPSFCYDYFLAIESQTSTLTRLNYAHDLKIFFYFLQEKKFRKSKTVKEMTLNDMEAVTGNDIEYFLGFLSRYFITGKSTLVTTAPRRESFLPFALCSSISSTRVL